MKYLTILGIIGICAMSSGLALIPQHNNPVIIPTPASAPTLAQDLDEIIRMVPFKPIHRVVLRYLLNDPQFQAAVRIANSYEAYIIQMRFRSQPEVMRFITWVRAQIMASGGEIKIDESEEFIQIINPTPFWSNSVFGWQGFVDEFKLYFPFDMINAHIQMKIAENGIFAQFAQRLKQLKPVYDSIIASPEAQRIVANLEANGINFAEFDHFIRVLCGWQHSPTVAAPLNATTVV